MSSLSDWHTRPKRTRHPPPISYWQEYVETDTWYLNKLVEDVPPEEMHAALYDDNFEDDRYSFVGEEGFDVGDRPEDFHSSEDEQSVDNDYLAPSDASEVSDATDELSDGTESEEDSGGESESGGESDTDSTEVLRTGEGQ